MSLQRVRNNSVIVHHYQTPALGRRNFVEPIASSCRAQSLASVPSSEAHWDNSPYQRAVFHSPMSDLPVSSSGKHVSFSQDVSVSGPVQKSPPRLSLPQSGPWHPPSEDQSQISARSSLSIHHSDTLGRSSFVPGDIAMPPESGAHGRSQRKSSNRDEFDGPHQFLTIPSPRTIAAKDQPAPVLPISLNSEEQDDIFDRLNEVLSKCAFDFVARYQFPIPIEPEKRFVNVPQDRGWTEWVYLLKRLATKRRIPARVLYDKQIKQLVTVLENSLEPPFGPSNEERPLRDDRNMLQFISAGIQVTKMLKDTPAMGSLDRLYIQTASCIQDRRWTGLPI